MSKPITLPTWLPEAFREDPKKTLILSGLSCVLLVVVARFYFSGPASAQAMPVSPAMTQELGPTNTTGVTIGPKEPAARLRQWVKTPIGEVSRNLFVIQTDRFPHLQGAGTLSEQKTFWDSLEKSQLQRADDDRQREVFVQNVQKEAGRLRLQSTMMSSRPQAIISGTMVREGSVIQADDASPTFKVHKIERQSVTVECEGVEIRLRMTP